MKKKILIFYMVLIIIGVSITGFFTAQVSRAFYKDEVHNRLLDNAQLIISNIDEMAANNSQPDYNKVAEKFSRILTTTSHSNSNTDIHITRVTIIDYNGKVLGESNTDFRDMENHLSRHEVQQAMTEGVGQDIRRSKTLGLDLLYLAVPVDNHNIILRLSVPLSQLNEINNTILGYTIIGILIGLLVTSLLALRFSNSITNPINKLTSLSREISAGNYSKRVEIKSKDELGQLSNTFNEMAYKLEKTVADLKDRNIKFDTVMNSMTNGVLAVDSEMKVILVNSIACDMFKIGNVSSVIGMHFQEVVRNNGINNLLEKTIDHNQSYSEEITMGVGDEIIFRINTAPIKSTVKGKKNSGGILSIHDMTNIKKLEHIRTEFVSNVTHELKTPLTSIRGFVETLRNGAAKDPEVAERFLEIIDIEAERLYSLINDILQLSEIESNRSENNVGTYKLLTIVKETVSILEKTADKKNVSLKIDIDNDISIIVNRNRLKQMLINLVDNAIKYNNQNGYVLVSAYKAEGAVNLLIRDNGIGIPEEHLSRVFERFYRVDKGRSRSMGGTGLGLSIVKHIVNLYNGNIKITSTPGEGTEFIIQLPS